jgi:ribosomal protein S18 acetylase RimI-like enzyme
VNIRPAQAGDAPQLAALSCSNGTTHQDEVEEWFHEVAWPWVVAEGPRYLILYLDESALVGACAFERDLRPDQYDWYVNAVAVSRDYRGIGHARRLMESCLDLMAQSTPGGFVTWLVHPENYGSHRMSEKLGAEATYPPEDQPFAVYVAQLP